MLEGRPKLKMDGIMPIMVRLFVRFAIRARLPVKLRMRTMPIAYMFGSITNARTNAPMPGLGSSTGEFDVRFARGQDAEAQQRRQARTLRSSARVYHSSFLVTDTPIGVPAGQAAYTWEAWIQYVEILDENPSGRSASTCAVTVALCFA